MRLSPVVQSLTEPLLSPLVSAITGVFGGGFSPRSLFADGSKGVFYDNNDFVDSATWRRNRITYSEDFANAAWSAAGNKPTITAGQPDPWGGNTATLITESNDGAPTLHGLQQALTSQIGTVTVGSIYAKAGTRTEVALQVGAGAAYINLTTGAVLSGSATVENAGNGWWRISFAITPINSNNIIYMSSGGTVSYTGNGTGTILIAAYQNELGSTATTYQRITDFNSDFLAAFPRTTLYEDAAGTTPARVNGLVGLQLDKSAGLVLGAEICTDPTLDTPASWIVENDTAAIVISGGVATIIATATSAMARNGSVAYITSGKNYEVIYNVGTFSGTFGPRLAVVAPTGTGGGTFNTSDYVQSTGRKRWQFTATGNGVIAINRVSGHTGTSTITDISVKELPGNHRYQTTTGSKPVLRGTPTGANLITNGDFASGTTGWSGTNATLSNVANRLRVTAVAGGAEAKAVWSLSTSAGKVYRVTAQYATDAGTGNAFIYAGSTSGAADLMLLIPGGTVGTYVGYFTAAGASSFISLSSASAILAAEYHEWDNIEVVDVSAGSVTAPYGLQYDGVDDFLQTAAVDFATATSDGLARRNLLTFPSAFDNAAWTKSNVSVTANAANNHLGVATADKLIPDAVSTQHRLDSAGAPVSNSTAYTISCYAKADGYGFIVLRLRDAVSTADAIFNLSTGAVGAITISSWSAGSSLIESLGSGWYRCSFTATSNVAGASASIAIGRINVGNPSSNGDISAWAGNGTDGILIWGAQVEAGSTASAFQDIGTDKMFVCAGVRKLSDAFDQATIAELGTNSAAAAGFALQGSPSLTARYRAQLYGTSRAVRDTSPVFAAPDLAVIAISFDIAGATVAEEIIGRRNGSVVFGENTLSPSGSGNFPSAIMYFGRRGGTAFPYNGLDFGMVICGKTLTSTQIANTERWMSYRTGVTL